MSRKILVLLVLALFIAPFIALAEEEKSKPLPAGGGDPGKAYASYVKILAAGDIDGIKKAVTADRGKQLDDPKMKAMLPMIQSMQPKDIKVTGGTMTSKEATLNVEGKD